MAVVAVIVIVLEPVVVGTEAQVIGSGLGGVRSGALVVADSELDQPVSFWAAALSRALTLNVYNVEGVRSEAIYVVLVCHPLLALPSVVHSKKYSTGILSSVAVVAVIVIVYGLVAVGTDAQVIGFGDGGVRSGTGGVRLVSISKSWAPVPGSSSIVWISSL